MSHFKYPCPDCRSTTDLHDPDCAFGGMSRTEIEKAYTDILAVLSTGPSGTTTLRRRSDEWSELHDAALQKLRQEHRVEENDGMLEMLTPEERTDRVSVPTQEPLRTIYEHGSVPGCHDNSVFALISYYEMVGFSWEETRDKVIDWLRESGAWDRGGFEEASPEELVDKKRHVYETGYGWKEKATAAKRVIDRRLK
ncbi:hypothetical protein K0C01_06890 [Salinarchaeum sp. IM2453]|uniref:DUF7474 family protein n=1 Tax=Salinarchaeum sp. IM2453 TaxID=2862870 RepID=UPI001C82F7D3|nr:hypothetical protein [Salinarchaeum sp. IM2453]QZA87545.1 hypothetical protein K0C01_06890 [Salinarchaeum sp. IM2453]